MFTGSYGMGLMGGLMQTVQTIGNNIGNIVAPLAEDEEEQFTRLIQGSFYISCNNVRIIFRRLNEQCQYFQISY